MAQLQYASIGPLVVANATNIRSATSIGGAIALTLNGSTVTNGVAILDNARKVLFTFAAGETGLILTMTGTAGDGSGRSEVINGPAGAGTVSSVFNYKTVTLVVSNQASNGAVSIGTQAINESNWIQFDRYAKGGVAVQLVVVGTVNYTLQQTLDDPNSTVHPVSMAAVTWVNSADSTVVAATASMQTNYQFPPAWVKILLSSGTGSVSGTFIQGG